jgi:hypothetical protein
MASGSRTPSRTQREFGGAPQTAVLRPDAVQRPPVHVRLYLVEHSHPSPHLWPSLTPLAAVLGIRADVGVGGDAVARSRYAGTTGAVAGSAHYQPNSGLAASPTSATADR